MRHQLPALPFPKNALQPILSAEQLELHHDKHHRAYVDKLNELVQGTAFESMALEEILEQSAEGPVFNNASQHWNHTFYWHSLTPERAREPGAELKATLARDFGSLEGFQRRFSEAATGVFGSGWAWLVRKDPDGKLAIETTSNAGNPRMAGKQPLLTIDVWEHAYYVDYRQDRARYLEQLWNAVNWEFAERNFQTHRGLAAA